MRKQFPIRSIILRSKGTLSGFKHTALQQSAFARPWYLWKGHKTIWRKAAQRNCVDQSPACQSRRPLSGAFSQNGNDASPVLRRIHQFPRTVSVRETQMLTRSTDCQSDEKTRKPKKQICRQGNLPGCKRPHTASADDRETSPLAEFVAPRLRLMFPQNLANASRKMKLLLPPFCQSGPCVCGPCLCSVTSPSGEVYRPAPVFDVPAEPGKCIKEEEIASVPVLPGRPLRLWALSVL